MASKWVDAPRGQITDHFSWEEAACKHCGKVPSVKAVEATAVWLERVRDALGGRPIHVNSWCRCEEHNTAVGGVPSSLHKLGWAVDMTVEGMTPGEVQAACHNLQRTPQHRGDGWVGGLGSYATWTHIDRGKTRSWSGP